MTQKIPPMTNPLGKYWEQPNRSEILIEDESAIMLNSTFEKLKNYSHSIPSGVYEGKMWKSIGKFGRPFLRWYQSIPGNTEMMDIVTVSIIVY